VLTRRGIIVLEHFDGVRSAGKAILEQHTLSDGSTHSFRDDLKFGLYIRQLELPWPGEHVGRGAQSHLLYLL
jgi:hypothetical protein